MRKNLFNLRGAVLAAALVAASATASADNFTATFNFDNVASGSTADSALGSYASLIHFGNADTVLDEDVNGYTGTFHWVDATSTYGDVLAKNDGTAVSGSNVLWNDHQPILVMFSTAQTISAFSVQQDSSNFGNIPETYIAYLDSTGHEIAGSQVSFSQYGNPGLTIQNNATFSNVSAILLTAGKSYDNLSITAVPEPDSWAMLAGGLVMLGAVARRRRA
jgi:hypothetical protein